MSIKIQGYVFINFNRLMYFLKYGIGAKERKPATIDPAEFGTYVHAVLEKTAKEIMEMGGFHDVSLEKTLEIANKYSQEYIAERFQQIDSQRVSYLFRRNTRELELVVTELWDELRQSKFEPAEFELAFGMGGPMDAININGKTMSARLRGFVDRVDVWKQGEQAYYRVVDYKTGKKDFDYCDVYNGLGLQMLLYLFALEDNGGYFLGDHPVGAGVQYFPARVPVLSADADLNDEEAANERLREKFGVYTAKSYDEIPEKLKMLVENKIIISDASNGTRTDCTKHDFKCISFYSYTLTYEQFYAKYGSSFRGFLFFLYNN